MDAIKNFAKAIVDDGGGVGYDEDDTVVTLLTGQGARLPLAGEYNAVWWNSTDYPDPADDPTVEIVRVTDRTDDDLTIVRAQEGTVAASHNLAGKTYQMQLAITRETIRQMLGNFSDLTNPRIVVDLTGNSIEISSARVDVGDPLGLGNSGVLSVVDDDGLASFNNLDIGTTQAQEASGPVGSVVGKLPIKDSSGTLLGYLPIYNSIT